MSHDGMTKKIESFEELIPGSIIRAVNSDGTIAPFSDTLVLGKGRLSEEKNPSFKLARPYGYATMTETCCPTPMVWAETYEAYFSVLKETHMLVLKSTGKPYIMEM